MLIILIGLIKIDLIKLITGLIIVTLSFLIMVCIKDNSIGGGDNKLIGACSFLLGLSMKMVTIL